MRTTNTVFHKNHAWVLLLVAGLLSQGCQAFSAESAYGKTKVGAVEIKQLPPSKILVTEGEGTYFDGANNLFMRLFNYIRKHDVAMTVPVEARINKATMIFYVGEEDANKDLNNQGWVKVLDSPGREVVSIGVRGSYTEKNFQAARNQLVKWLLQQDRYESLGDPYAVYWNGPYVPGFMKRFEVHIPVKQVQNKIGDAPALLVQKIDS